MVRKYGGVIRPDVDELVAQVREDGYAIVEDAIDPQLVDTIVEDLANLEAELDIAPGDNSFEGEATTRLYNLLAHGLPWIDLPVHPVILPVAEAILGGEILVSTVSSIAIAPGETAQPIHADDQVMPLARPKVPTVCNSMWALTDFTEENVVGFLSNQNRETLIGERFNEVRDRVSKARLVRSLTDYSRAPWRRL